MTRFTNSQLEREMTRRHEVKPQPPPAPPPTHPCYGCGNYGQPCVGFCYRKLLEGRNVRHSAHK